VREGWIEFKHRDTALDTEINVSHPGHGFERVAQDWQVFGFETSDGEDCGFCAHGNLQSCRDFDKFDTNAQSVGFILRSLLFQKFSLRQNYLDELSACV